MCQFEASFTEDSEDAWKDRDLGPQGGLWTEVGGTPSLRTRGHLRELTKDRPHGITKPGLVLEMKYVQRWHPSASDSQKERKGLERSCIWAELPASRSALLHSAGMDATQAASGLWRVFEKAVQCSFRIIRKMLLIITALL